MVSLLARFLSRLAALVGSNRLDRELDRELGTHLEMLEEDHVRRGMPRDEARRVAQLELGAGGGLRDAHRDARGLPMVEDGLRDLRYALRSLGRNPGFSAVAVLTLAVGIGANTAMFSVTYGVLLRPLDYPEPERLVQVGRVIQGQPQNGWFTIGRLGALRTARSFTALAGYFRAPQDVTFSGVAEPEVLQAARVSGNFLDVLEVKPVAGRSFLPEEDRAGAVPVVMISAELWRRQFAADPAIAGKSALFNSTPHTIVGVLPPRFRFPFPDVDVWFPRPAETSFLPARFHACCSQLRGVGRLRPGITLDQATAELTVISDAYTKATPVTLDKGAMGAAPLPLRDALTTGVSTMLWMLLAAVGFVLVIACANVATLLMARATSRARELAIRAAVGAARARLIRQLLTESLVLSVAGGVAGLLLSRLALAALAQMTIFELPRVDDVEISGPVLVFTAAVSIVTGLLFGTIPSLHVLKPALVERLRLGGITEPSAMSGPGRLRFSARSAMVVAQVALSVVLLVGAALMLRSLARLTGVDSGFRSEGLLTMRVPLPAARYDTPAKRNAFFEQVLARVQSLPGVRSATMAAFLPTTGALSTNIQIQSQPIPDPGHVGMMLQTVMPGYFDVLGVSIRLGRPFEARDNVEGAPRAVIVNETFARRFWPSYPASSIPLGERLVIPIMGSQPLEIVGVAADVRHGGNEQDAPPQLYIPDVLNPPQGAFLAVRTDGDPLASVAAIRAAVRAIDPDQSLASVRMMDDVLTTSQGQRHLAARVLGLFAATALLLAMIGLYGVLAYSVSQRTHEIGIRRTLGAQRRDVLGLVVGQAARLIAVGLTLGLLGALAFTRLLETLLFQISANDRQTFLLVGVSFAVVALAAALVPAWRALRIQPLTALRAG
jgi:predicted permease